MNGGCGEGVFFFFFCVQCFLFMLANVRRGDVLVSSSDESEVELDVSSNGFRHLVSQLADSPPPAMSENARLWTLVSLMDRLVRKRLKSGWSSLRPERNQIRNSFTKLRQLFGFQLLTSTLKSHESRLMSSTILSLATSSRYPRSIKAS